ncbi:MAG TPA: c-type cytochrome [Nevskiaceae bacterium]
MLRLALAFALIVPVVALAADNSPASPASVNSPPNLFVGGNAQVGAKKAVTCEACHGPNGNGAISPQFPKLADQGAAYLLEQLQEFKDQTRKNPIMFAQASVLSKADMGDLAAFFSEQPFVPGVATPESVKLAQPLYRGGDPAKGIPACAACHGPTGAGDPAALYPRIGGQNAAYVVEQLKAFRAGTRGDANMRGKVMQDVASKLSDQQIDELAAYVAGLR